MTIFKGPFFIEGTFFLTTITLQVIEAAFLACRQATHRKNNQLTRYIVNFELLLIQQNTVVLIEQCKQGSSQCLLKIDSEEWSCRFHKYWTHRYLLEVLDDYSKKYIVKTYK
jgi:hypothetical protein